ncbi:PREDICTED: actin-related protein 2/3 complex subunit 1A-like [Priapulus caudatus]|uniref:Actin-related protein 2/3 complex subunit n=1 Tax=Priapulus caudatus TaxID=37621 RepID=A0ABM1DUB4_PRICU|nr:PREDICTED: actin-related protein 2/3 complex subunit 1A-like [Priapulus caudatus]
MTTPYSFGVDPISCHAWNKDCSELAMSPNSSEVHVYRWKDGKWDLYDVLTEHEQRVTSIDWAHSSNRLVTCGADRNAYVWSFNGSKWKPTLVILRINRAATCVKWSPLENKFAVGSGARLISVCYFEQENDWWVSKHIKKPIRSTVTSIDWHPNNVLIAAGSSDFKARVFSGYIKEVDEKPSSTPWGKKMTLGNMMAEFSNGGGGWAHCVSFSASGNKLAWVGHDSSISVVDAANDMAISTIKTDNLPYMTCQWVTEYSIVVAGHDCLPFVFCHDEGKLSFVERMDVKTEKAASKFSAKAIFQSMDRHGEREGTGVECDTLHQNAIKQVTIHTGTKAGASKISTCGVDGQVIIWDFKTLESRIANLRIV